MTYGDDFVPSIVIFMCMEQLRLLNIKMIGESPNYTMELEYKSILTGESYFIETKKIRHRLEEVVTIEFLEEIYINTPNYNANERPKKKI